jgi:hypothetical protein
MVPKRRDRKETRVAYKDTIIDDLLVGSIDLHVHG